MTSMINSPKELEFPGNSHQLLITCSWYINTPAPLSLRWWFYMGS